MDGTEYDCEHPTYGEKYGCDHCPMFGRHNGKRKYHLRPENIKQKETKTEPIQAPFL